MMSLRFINIYIYTFFGGCGGGEGVSGGGGAIT